MMATINNCAIRLRWRSAMPWRLAVAVAIEGPAAPCRSPCSAQAAARSSASASPIRLRHHPPASPPGCRCRSSAMPPDPFGVGRKNRREMNSIANKQHTAERKTRTIHATHFIQRRRHQTERHQRRDHAGRNCRAPSPLGAGRRSVRPPARRIGQERSNRCNQEHQKPVTHPPMVLAAPAQRQL